MPHQIVVVSVERQHREAVDPLPRWGSPRCPLPRHAQHAAVRCSEHRQQSEVRLDRLELGHGLIARIALGGTPDDRRELRRVDMRSTARRLQLGGKAIYPTLLKELATPFGLVVTAPGDSVMTRLNPVCSNLAF